MGRTVRDIADEMSELESRRAVWRHIHTYLTSHCLEGDAGLAVRIRRSDGAPVPELHMNDILDEIETTIQETEAQANDLAGMKVETNAKPKPATAKRRAPKRRKP